MDEQEPTYIPEGHRHLNVRVGDDGKITVQRNDGPEQKGLWAGLEILDTAWTYVGATCAGLLAQWAALMIGRHAIYDDLHYHQEVLGKKRDRKHPSKFDRGMVWIGATAIGTAVTAGVLKASFSEAPISMEVEYPEIVIAPDEENDEKDEE